MRNKKKKRHEFSVHGFRKFFKTRSELGGMKPINVETLMGHSVGISDSYYRPTENELLEDYLKVIDHLIIIGESRLKMQLEEMRKIKEKEDINTDAIGTLADQVAKLTEEIERLKKSS